MIYYIAFGPFFYHHPKGYQNESIGYGYMLDPQALCSSYKSQNICNGDLECENEVYDTPKCIKAMNLYLDRLNSECNSEINALESCREQDQPCRAEQHKFFNCESFLPRPNWLQDSSFVYLHRLRGPFI